MVRIHPLIREIFQGDNNAAAAATVGKVILHNYTLWVKNFVKIALSRSVSEINSFLRLMQKFKMAAKNGRKTIFAKSRQ